MTAQAITKPGPREVSTEAGMPSPVNMLQVISRAAADPSVDIDKMERLMAMHERMVAKEAEATYYAALSEMAGEIPPIPTRGEIKNKEGRVQSRYPLWEDTNEIIQPILKRHGFALFFTTGRAEERMTVTGVLTHKDGHREQTTIELPLDVSGSKNNVQGVGSSTSYGKRYAAAALLNLTSTDSEDDDGRAAGAGQMISEAQQAALLALADEVGADKARFCNHFKVASFAHIPVRRFEEAQVALEQKRAARRAEAGQ